MHYQITEEEFNCLDAVRGQIAVMAGMLSMMNSDLSCLRSTDLHDAIEVQRTTLQGVMEAVQARGVLRDTPKTLASISPALLTATIRAASGEDVGQDLLKDINDQLCDRAMQDRGYGEALRAYYAALGRKGYAVETRIHRGAAETTFQRQRMPVQAPRRKRNNLVAA